MKLFVLVLALFLTGCTTIDSGKLLPSKETESIGFSSYGQAVEAINHIVINETTELELIANGFNPSNATNMKLLTYTDVVGTFLSNPNLTKDDIPKGIVDCLKAQGGCKAYQFNAEHINEERYGNFLIDALNFRKRTKTQGWTFEAMIVVVDGVVVYTHHSGEPNINKKEVKRNPLGPLQGLDVDDVRKLR
jgi:hypothetical protein